jgi:hypothetical protein
MKSSFPSNPVLLRLATVKRTFCFGVWGTSYLGDLQTSITGADKAGPRNQSALAEAVRDQAARLPVELRRAVLGDAPSGPPGSSSEYLLADPDFARRYEEALQGLTEEQLRAVARLNQARLKEWVYSPALIRRVKLEQWAQEKTAGDSFTELLSSAGPNGRAARKVIHSPLGK